MSDQLTILSFGGGQDSTTLLYKYVYDQGFRSKYAPNDFLVIMSDTGDEHRDTYSHVENIKKFCGKNKIEFVHLTSDMGYHYDSWQSLRGFYNLKNTVGSKAFPKTCTDKLKIQPIYKFLEDWLHKKYGVDKGRKKAFLRFAERYGKIKMMIGIASGEEKRMADPSKDSMKWRKKSINHIYPLVDLGLDRKGCQEYISSTGNQVPVPSNCILCPFMNEIELLWLYRFHPEDYQDWVRIEENKLKANEDKGNKNLGVWGRKFLPEKLNEAVAKYGYMTDEELKEYKMSHGHCVMSKY